MTRRGSSAAPAISRRSPGQISSFAEHGEALGAIDVRATLS